MKILGISDKCLQYAGLGIAPHFQVANERVSRAFVRCVVIGGQLAGVNMFAMIVKTNMALGLQAILFPLHVIVLSTIKISVFVVLMTKSTRMAELGDYLQRVVDKRKRILVFCVTFILCLSDRLLSYLVTKFVFSSSTLHFNDSNCVILQYQLSYRAGCSRSPESMAIYAQPTSCE